jgi:hypothetical protein
MTDHLLPSILHIVKMFLHIRIAVWEEQNFMLHIFMKILQRVQIVHIYFAFSMPHKKKSHKDLNQMITEVTILDLLFVYRKLNLMHP